MKFLKNFREFAVLLGLVLLIGPITGWLIQKLNLDLSGKIGAASAAAIIFVYFAFRHKFYDLERNKIFRKAMIDNRLIFLNGKVDDELSAKVLLKIFYLNVKSKAPIKLLINSCGGDAHEARLIINSIIASKAPVHGIIVGQAYSAAAIILQACEKRLALPQATIFFHHGGASCNIEIEHGKVENIVKILENIREEIMKNNKIFEEYLISR